MPPPMCCIFTRFARSSRSGSCARTARRLPRPVSPSCRPGPASTLPAGTTPTFLPTARKRLARLRAMADATGRQAGPKRLYHAQGPRLTGVAVPDSGLHGSRGFCPSSSAGRGDPRRGGSGVRHGPGGGGRAYARRSCCRARGVAPPFAPGAHHAHPGAGKRACAASGDRRHDRGKQLPERAGPRHGEFHRRRACHGQFRNCPATTVIAPTACRPSARSSASGDPRIIDLETIVAQLRISADQSLEITATRGTYNSAEETLLLADGIDVVTNDGETATFGTLDITLKTGTIRSDDPVELTSSFGALRAGRMQFDQDNGTLTFTQGIQMTIQPPQSETTQ